MMHDARSSIACLAAAVLACALAAHAADTPAVEKPRPAAPVLGAVGELSAQQAQQFWKLHWKAYADATARLDGDFYVCPAWDRRYPSSRMITLERFIDEHTEKQRVAVGGGLTKIKAVAPLREDAVPAATTIPALKPGQWGHIHSAQVVEVIGPNDMIVTDVWLIDAERIQREIADAEKRGDEILREIQERERIERERERERERQRDRDSRSRGFEGDRGGDSFRRDRDRDEERERAPTLSAADIRKEIDRRYEHRRQLLGEQKGLAKTTLWLRGYSTAGAAAGTRWTGPKTNSPLDLGPRIAVVAVGDDPRKPATTAAAGSGRFTRSSASRDRILVALNADAFSASMTESEFAAALAERGVSPEQFVELVREQLKLKSPEEARPAVFAELEKRGQAKREADAKAAAEAAKTDAASRRTDKPDADKPAAESDKPSSLQERLQRLREERERRRAERDADK